MGEGSSNSVSEQWSSNSGRQTRGRQTVDVNSVVQEGSSNSGREQCRPIGVVKQGVVKQWT